VDLVVKAVWFAVGLALVVAVLDAAVRSLVLPRGSVVSLTRIIWVSSRKVFNLWAGLRKTYEGRDRIMALYAPITLLVQPAVWLAMVLAGFMMMFHAFGVSSWRSAFSESGSSLFTLGFVHPRDLPTTVLAFAEAAIGLGVLALFIAYLPNIYNAFSRREVLVAKLSARAGTPPSSMDFLVRVSRIDELTELDDVWQQWQDWFAEIEETHTSQASLSFFRSPRSDRSWITAAGVVLDSAALANSTVDIPWSPDAALCVRAGYSALRAIADFFGIPYDPEPQQTDPTSIAREEFDDACRQLADAGVPLKSDLDQAWIDFNGWRVNYDAVLVAIAGLVVAPYATWSSDRSLRRVALPPIRRRGRRRSRS
jgi:ABC-type multidrug transport system fused ATPase/permease subunit